VSQPIRYMSPFPRLNKNYVWFVIQRQMTSAVDTYNVESILLRRIVLQAWLEQRKVPGQSIGIGEWGNVVLLFWRAEPECQLLFVRWDPHKTNRLCEFHSTRLNSINEHSDFNSMPRSRAVHGVHSEKVRAAIWSQLLKSLNERISSGTVEISLLKSC
jgi:hypothetical protein